MNITDGIYSMYEKLDVDIILIAILVSTLCKTEVLDGQNALHYYSDIQNI